MKQQPVGKRGVQWNLRTYQERHPVRLKEKPYSKLIPQDSVLFEMSAKERTSLKYEVEVDEKDADEFQLYLPIALTFLFIMG